MTFQYTAPGLDDLLLDVVTVIELGDHDREVAENRYRKLKPDDFANEFGCAARIFAPGRRFCICRRGLLTTGQDLQFQA